jgi:carotenoid phi-ring synthase / carotenoid chi-ring synthase
MIAQTQAFPVVIVGGGLAGLTAAVHLAERGIPPLVLEADSTYAGGRLQGGAPNSFEHQGRHWSFASEHGMHALWGNYDNMRTMLARLAPLTFRPSEGEDWLYRRGREIRRAEAGSAVRLTAWPAPIHYLQLLFLPRFWAGISFLDIGAAPGFLVSLLLTLGVDPLMEEIRWEGLGLNDYFLGWTPNLRATFIGLGRNLLAQPAETISLTAMIAAARFYTTLRRDAWSVDYLPDNPQHCLIAPLVAIIERGGGKVMLGARATRLERISPSPRVERGPGGEAAWRIAIDDAQRGSRALTAERVILALDAPAAEKLLASSPDTASAASALRFPRGLPSAAIRLWFDRQPDWPGMPGGMLTGDFALDNFFWLDRLRPDFRNWALDTGGGCLEMHLYATPQMFTQSDHDLLALAVGETHRAWPELKGHLVHGEVRRNEATQPEFSIPRRDDSLYVETPWEGIGACGDWIGYPTPALNMERSVITAIAAANAVITAHGGEPFPIAPPRPPERLARVIGGLVRLMRKIVGPLAWRMVKKRRRSAIS